MLRQLRYLTTKVPEDILVKKVKPPHPGEVMSAWQVTHFGGIDSLTFTESAKVPELRRADDLRVKVLASSVNPLDLLMLEGYGNVVLDSLRKLNGLLECRESISLPLITGRDFCGEVISKGPKVRSNIRLGDIVYGVVPPHQQGSHAEQLVVSQDLVCGKPSGLSSTEAASLPYTGLTAWSALKISGDLSVVDPKSQRVLLLGAAGGVGTAALQLLKAWGSTVVATCSPDAIPLVSSLKADLVLDYTKKESLREIELAGKYDIILDAAGTVNSTTYLPFLKEWSNSKFITLKSPFLKNTDSLGLMGGLVKNAVSLLETNLSGDALIKGRTVRWGFFAPLGAALTEINDLIHRGQMRAVIDSEWSYSDGLVDSFRRVKEGHLRGKVVLSHLPSSQSAH